MPDFFDSIFQSSTATIAPKDFIICIAVSLLSGLVFSLLYSFKNESTKSFSVSLFLIPTAVCAVIMTVNGNIGAGVAVAGAFGLVRFRSAAGSAKEISVIFLAMSAGLMLGMGYLAYGFLYSLALSVIFAALNVSRFGESKVNPQKKTLKITIPEDLNYSDAFADLFFEYTSKTELLGVKTSNMGSLFKLTYDVDLQKDKSEKEFIDKLRERNGNLEIALNRREKIQNEL